ncbi:MULTISPECIES: hypothetical protein [unclassified Thiomonas]|uniref:hypothetical protein n=1 Tax=unclassified Thiomonas TaxID=2625466 RepID=UPI0004DBAD01|nr:MULTISPECIES: hypothetical protein [unclassified Thiomonas]CDW96342.1 conserved hypothetical protein [Thiomonas sp. CB2]VDY06730.1 protein of unknown function [Thiomonas sp. Bio17B3]VDY09976.1 protein of unknown function [Thiomonas sp. Sup16B3]VDY11218.1 protein of unknown function [Thiomonas sp. Sup16B3]VDY11243.1 protein of unknown function [Thiomonas sp. Bio17B3]
MTRRLIAALPPRAAAALALARGFDRACDPAAAWLAARERPTATPDQLARALRAEARRDRRAGGAHGPAAFHQLPEGFDAVGGDDPADLVGADQEVGQRVGLAAALAELEPASDSRRLAASCRVSQRRAQQVLAARRRALDAGQGVLL